MMLITTVCAGGGETHPIRKETHVRSSTQHTHTIYYWLHTDFMRFLPHKALSGVAPPSSKCLYTIWCTVYGGRMLSPETNKHKNMHLSYQIHLEYYI